MKEILIIWSNLSVYLIKFIKIIIYCRAFLENCIVKKLKKKKKNWNLITIKEFAKNKERIRIIV